MAGDMINEANEAFLTTIKDEVKSFFRAQRDDVFSERIDFFEELETFARVEKEAWTEDMNNYYEEGGL